MIKVERLKYSWPCQLRLPVIKKAWSPSLGERYFICSENLTWLKCRSELLEAIQGRWGKEEAELASAVCSGDTVVDLKRRLARFNGAKSVAELLDL